MKIMWLLLTLIIIGFTSCYRSHDSGKASIKLAIVQEKEQWKEALDNKQYLKVINHAEQITNYYRVLKNVDNVKRWESITQFNIQWYQMSKQQEILSRSQNVQ